MAKIERNDVRQLMQRFEAFLNQEVPGTPRVPRTGGRVMYVALPGTGRKSQNVLSNRAKQVLGAINRRRRATAAALQDTLKVNRNVIAGAIHELKQAQFVHAIPVGGPIQSISGMGDRSDDRPRRTRKKAAAK